MSGLLIKLTHVERDYQLGETQFTALSDIHFQLKAGEMCALAGASGSGKSTLLNILGLLDLPTRGVMSFQNQILDHPSDEKLTQLRLQHIGMVFQNFNLFPVLTAKENVLYALQYAPLSHAEKEQKAQQALEKVGLKDFFARRPHQLSGGQRQRVAIARALVKKPTLVIADEPTANLDKKNAQELITLMRELNQHDRISFVIASHDSLILEKCPRVVTLSDGKIIRDEGKA